MGGDPGTRRSKAGLPPAYAAAVRRSVRVTVAAAAGFYLFLYGFDSPVAATYALFAAVAMAGLSRIPGNGRQRAATLLPVVPACWVLITIGTYLSVRTWSAVLGMLVVGFVLAFMAVGGPRPAGAAPGLQLMYILPSFPPYVPGTLGERLVGATVGLLVLILAEAFLLPDRAPRVPYRELAARAAESAGRCADQLVSAPYALGDAARRTARETSGGLRSSRVPEAERPAGPGVRPRALTHTGLAARTLLGRLAALPPHAGDPAEGGAAPEVLREVRDASLEAAARLRGNDRPRGARPHPQEPAPARGRLQEARHSLAAGAAPGATPAALRRHAAVLEVADAALAMSTAAEIAVLGRAAPAAAPGRFWYARMRAPQLWWHRISGHAGQRSVFFQNAVRTALALAAARTIAGLDTLPHGFWMLLATLTLTRTTARETRSTVRVALTGTLVGALVVAALLSLVGTDTTVYAAALPPLMLVAFTLGPVKGVGWAQAMFTMVVALVFAQLAPATWQLAEFRLLDVVAGSAVGAVFGLLAWPRGAHDELRRAVATMLRSAAETVVSTTSQLAAGGARAPVAVSPGHRSLQHALIMAESAYAQYRSEPAELNAPDDPQDWQAALMSGHHTLWGADRLLVPFEPTVVPPLPRDSAASATRIGDRVAAGMLLVSARLDPGGDTPGRPAAADPRAFVDFAAEPPGAPRPYYATVEWLEALMTDVERISENRKIAEHREG
ncbi:FUSC family protein [Streptomyces sp. adm13(2018)]|uniref:FUSC family protein n=1 Tax=unclassified Streptomyces TaxID=2593676 RepID=UPI0011CDC204|nr:FUSC family protein [Streptomyces sp. adm13(2018)]TXS15411.1 FUSC family protein [Streptomyces sp. adm13(2018)]